MPDEHAVAEGSEDQAQPAYAAPEIAETAPTQFIPYRGAEQHGVAFVGPIPPDPEVTSIINPDAANVIVTYDPEVEQPAPIPVIDVSETPETRRMFVATSIAIPASANHPSQLAPRILNRRPNRTKARISTKKIPGAASGPDRIWISESESPVANTGSFPFDTADLYFETNTTEDIYAILDTPTNGALVCVYEEYEIPA